MRHTQRHSTTSMPTTVGTAMGCALILAGCASPDNGNISSDARGQTTPATETSLSQISDTVAGTGGPEADSIPVPAPIAAKWRDQGGATGSLGPAKSPPSTVGEMTRVDFYGGSVFLTEGRATIVQGELLRAYDHEGGPAGLLGPPTTDEATTDGGWISVFAHGTITYINGHAEVLQK